MSAMQTRPIPDFAVEALKGRRLAALRETESPQDNPTAPGLPSSEIVGALVATSRGRNQRISPWRLAQDAAAATALAFLAPCAPRVPMTLGVGEFLVVLADNGVSRAMLDINEVKSDQEAVFSRAAASMQPMDLSRAEALVVQQALTSGSARPRIKIAPLPEFRG